MILTNPQLATKLNGATLFLDTNVISGAAKNRAFFDALLNLKDIGCAFATIPSVIFETTKGSQTVKVFNERQELAIGLIDRMIPVEKSMGDVRDFTLVMQKLNPDKSEYTDFLLAVCLYIYRSSNTYVLSRDLKAFPKDVFKRELAISADHSNDIHTYCLFSLDWDNYEKAAAQMVA